MNKERNMAQKNSKKSFTGMNTADINAAKKKEVLRL